MNALGIIKPAVEIITAIGVGAVVSNVVKFTTPLEMGLIQKISVRVGTVLLSSAISSAVYQHTIRPINDAFAALDKTKTEQKSPKEQS